MWWLLSTLLLKGLDEGPARSARKVRAKLNAATANVQHSAENPDWVTDKDTLDVERAMWAELGLEIDLDPYSCEVANRLVRARRIFTMADDGHAQSWQCDSAHINPPGRQVVDAWRKLVDEWRAGRCLRACWIGFSVEQLCILADPESEDSYPHPCDFSIVYLRKRIPFVEEQTIVDAGDALDDIEGSRPSHGNYVVLVGVPNDVVDRHWGPLGRVFHGEFAAIAGIGSTTQRL